MLVSHTTALKVARLLDPNNSVYTADYLLRWCRSCPLLVACGCRLTLVRAGCVERYRLTGGMWDGSDVRHVLSLAEKRFPG